MMINRPIYCVTSDIDWADDPYIEDFLNITMDFNINPTLFATHDSVVVEKYMRNNKIDVGVHPNFAEDSSHGEDYLSVIDHVFRLYPNAKTFRSHSFFDSTQILTEMSHRGIKYDSNLCLYLQPNITPLRLAIPNMIRIPVFWEDDFHWMNTGGDWDLNHFVDAFETPGIKVLNIHPFNFSGNIPNYEYYLHIKKYSTELLHDNISSIRYHGDGARTFAIKLFKYLISKDAEIYTLDQIYNMFTLDLSNMQNDATSGLDTIQTK